MKKDEIEKLLENVATPISQIEADLGMPKTTLQKALKGQRELPKKWAIALKMAFGTIRSEVAPKVAPPVIDKPVEAAPKSDYNPFNNPRFNSKNK